MTRPSGTVVCASEAPPQHDQQCTDPRDCYCDVRRHERAAWTAAITTAATNALRDIPGTRGLPAVIASEATRTIQKETDHG